MFAGLAGWHLALLGVILLVVIAIPVIAIVLIIRWTRRTSRGDTAASLVSATLSISTAYAALLLVGAIVNLTTTLLSPFVTLTVPVRPYWPMPLPGVEVQNGPTADILSGSITHAELTLEGLSTGARLLWAGGQALYTLMPIAIAALIALVCFQLLRGAPFAPAVARASAATALVVLIGGSAAQIMSGVAGSMASREALDLTGWGMDGYPEEFDLHMVVPASTFDVPFDFWPIGAALGFIALSAVFRYGTALQRDTDLLV